MVHQNDPHNYSPLGQIPARWKLAKLKDITTKIGSGATPKGGEMAYLNTRSHYALIRSQNVFDRRFNEGGLAFISDAQANELKNVVVRQGDLLLNITGDGITFARACLAPSYVLPACVNQHVSIIRSNPDLCLPEYLLAYLTHPDIKGYIESFNAGGSRRAITKGHIESFVIPLPSLDEQRAIGSVLGAMDDKIEINSRMNATLESMIRAVFHQWFVENEEVADWEAGKFNDISGLSRGAITPNQFPNETFNHYSIPAFDENQFPEQELGRGILSNKFFVPDTCVLISKLNPETQRVWIPFQISGRSICSTEFLVNVPKSYFSVEYLYGLFISQPFHDRFSSMITGTSSSHQRVKPEYLLGMDTQVPPESLVMEYTETVKPLLHKVQQNILESRTLTSLRDSLLPKLMRGEVRVKDVEGHIE